MDSVALPWMWKRLDEELPDGDAFEIDSERAKRVKARSNSGSDDRRHWSMDSANVMNMPSAALEVL